MQKLYIVLISVVCVIIDQITKLLISSNIELNSSVSIINNVLNFTYIHNNGLAFGLFNNLTYFIIIITIVIFILLTKEIKKYFIVKPVLISYSMIIGGLFGNLIDRLLFGYVRDFIDVNFLSFPIFNFSDIFIVIGTIILIISCFKLEGSNGKNSSRKN